MRITSIPILIAASALACGRPQAASSVKPTYDAHTGVLTRLEADANHDGKIDTWAYMDGTRVVRIEVDENGDGKPDRWEYYAAAAQRAEGSGQSSGRGGQNPDKTIDRIERATRYDGVVSRREFYDKGMLVRLETDTDGDGKIDKWETYSGGTLLTMAIDTQHRGKPDRRLVYRPDGTLDRIEIDPAGSGDFQPLPPQAAR